MNSLWAVSIATVIFNLIMALPLCASEGLVFNSGFELGNYGFTCRKYLRRGVNKNMEFVAPVIDKSAYFSGTQSLCLKNPYAEETELFLREIRLEGKSEYDFSVRMKSSAKDYPVKIRVISYSPKRKKWCYDKSTTVKVGKEWGEYKLAISTPAIVKNNEYEYYTIFFTSGFKKDSKAVDLWFDEMTLKKESGSKTLNKADINVALEFDQKLFITDFKNANGKAECRVNAINNTDKDISEKLVVNIINDADNKKIKSQMLELKLKAKERVTLPFNVPLEKYGAFHAEATLDKNSNLLCDSVDGNFAVCGKYEQKPIDIDDTYCVGINVTVGDSPSNLGVKRGVRMYNMSPDDYVGLYTKMGCRIFRDWDGECGPSVFWKDDEPVEGQYDFSNFEWCLSLTEKHGVTLIPVVGGRMGHSKKSYNPMPEWLLKKSIKREKTPYKNRVLTTPFMPPENMWRNYLEAFAQKFGKRLTHTEIINEPNADYFPEEYLVYLKSAYQIIKKFNSGSKVIGICSSGDWGLPAGSFLEECIKLGGLNYMDITSYHPYENPKYPEASEMNKICMDIISKYSQDQKVPLWNTELYYLTRTRGDIDCKPHDIAQRFLVDLSDGLGQSVCISARQVWKRNLCKNLGSHYGVEWIPSENYVVNNALARYFEGAKPVKKLKLNKDVLCNVYARENKYIAAFWNISRNAITGHIAGSDKRGVLLDLLGNTVETTKGGFAVDSNPYYLTWDNNDLQGFNFYINAINFEYANSLLSSEVARVVNEDGRVYALISLKNLNGVNAAGKVCEVNSDSVEYMIKPNSSSGVLLPLAAQAIYGKQIKIKLSGDGKTQEQVIDKIFENQLYDTQGKEVAVSRNITKATALHCASFKVNVKGDSVCFVFNVKDKTPSGATEGRSPWSQDCIELFFDFSPATFSNGKIPAYADKVGRLFILPYAPTGSQLVVATDENYKLNVSAYKLNVVKNDEGYSAELLVPVSEFKNAAGHGLFFGFDVKVDDASEKGAGVSAVSWSSKGHAHADYLEFGLVKLKLE